MILDDFIVVNVCLHVNQSKFPAKARSPACSDLLKTCLRACISGRERRSRDDGIEIDDKDAADDGEVRRRLQIMRSKTTKANSKVTFLHVGTGNFCGWITSICSM